MNKIHLHVIWHQKSYIFTMHQPTSCNFIASNRYVIKNMWLTWSSDKSRYSDHHNWHRYLLQCWAGGVFYTTTWTTLILPRGSCFGVESRWESRGEKRLALLWYTCKVYILHSLWHYVVLYSCDNDDMYASSMMNAYWYSACDWCSP